MDKGKWGPDDGALTLCTLIQGSKGSRTQVEEASRGEYTVPLKPDTRLFFHYSSIRTEKGVLVLALTTN
jgi:hypothetical protein